MTFCSVLGLFGMRTLTHQVIPESLMAVFVASWSDCPRSAKPEQEKALLSMLINKLGDSSSKATCG